VYHGALQALAFAVVFRLRYQMLCLGKLRLVSKQNMSLLGFLLGNNLVCYYFILINICVAYSVLKNDWQGMCFSFPTPNDPFNDRNGKLSLSCA
jgi:hypothetical protein